MHPTKGVLLFLPETIDEKGYYEVNNTKIYLPVKHDDRTTHARFAEVAEGEHKGKIAYFHQMCFSNAKTFSNGKALFEHDGVRYMIITEEDIFFYINKDGIIEMMPQWVLAIMDEGKENLSIEGYGNVTGRKTESGLFVPEFKQDHKKHKRAIIKHVPADCEVNVGDRVLLDTACERYVEVGINKTLSENYVYVNVNHIIGVCEN